MIRYWNREMKEIDREKAMAEGTYFGLESTDRGYRTRIAYSGELVYIDDMLDYGAAVDRILTYFDFLRDED